MLNITDVTQPGRSGRLHHQTDDSRKQTQGPQTSHHFSSICLCSHSYLPTRGSKVQIIGLGTINISWAPNPVLSIKTTKIYFEDKKKKNSGGLATVIQGCQTHFTSWATHSLLWSQLGQTSLLHIQTLRRLHIRKKEVHFQQNVSVFLHDKEILLQ